MSGTLARKKLGATEFEHIPDFMTGSSQATVFSAASDNVIDAGWIAILEKLQSFDDYQDDWDGMGSPAPDPEILLATKVLAMQLRRIEHPAPDRVLVTADGTVCFETGPFPIQTLEVTSGSVAELWESGNHLGTYQIGMSH